MAINFKCNRPDYHGKKVNLSNFPSSACLSNRIKNISETKIPIRESYIVKNGKRMCPSRNVGLESSLSAGNERVKYCCLPQWVL